MIPFFFFNDTATTEIYTLSLHDALPICQLLRRSPFANQLDEPLPELRRVRPMALRHRGRSFPPQPWGVHGTGSTPVDRKSTRLNSSHGYISYAVFCLKKKNNSAPTRLKC